MKPFLFLAMSFFVSVYAVDSLAEKTPCSLKEGYETARNLRLEQIFNDEIKLHFASTPWLFVKDETRVELKKKFLDRCQGKSLLLCNSFRHILKKYSYEVLYEHHFPSIVNLGK